ncbi:PREDICTED: protein timeless homolog isoform X2 [Lupinus angustifolius]|uniref:protein timeless homolog isoform X2 n=1 Tax=Lupinus angustifolius TaxID=3871 RepID=UPI00092EAE31|nr:PREDICTED: protein timeless homolog isoform X2 [Lupinus angustifolius]
METEGLSVTCVGLGSIEEDDYGNRIGYANTEYCLDNLKDLLRFLRRDDPQSRTVFKQVCKWNIVSKNLIPIIEYCHHDRNLLLNAVKVLVFLTMPIEPSSTDIPQQLEYLWGLKAAVTNSDVAAVTVSILEKPLENLECNAFTEDDWKLVQLVLTLFRNILAVQEIPLQQQSGGFASQLLSLRDRFLELLFNENVTDIILAIAQYVGGSNVYLRQDNLLLLEIFHYIFMGQDPELIVKGHLNGLKADEGSQASLSSLQSIMEEEKKKINICRLNNMSRHSQFSGTFARLTMDGSKAVIKGNPNSSRNILHKSQNIIRGPTKKIAWDHPKLPSTKDKILELLHGFLNQFLSVGYNVLMRSIREDIEKEHPAIQRSDVVVFFEVAEFVTAFQFYKYSTSKTKEGGDAFETFGDKDADTSDFSGQLCGPIASSLNESMFQLVISKWRNAYDGLKETNDYKFLSAAGSLLKNMIRMLDLVLKLLPEDSKEPQTTRILLYKLFYDQTEEGMTHFLLNLMKMFDTYKQPKSDLADLVEIIHKVIKLMNNLQSRGTLRVSKKSRKVKKKKFPEETISGNKPTEDHSSIQKEADTPVGNQLTENQLLQKEYQLNPSSTGDEDSAVPNDNEHENDDDEGRNSHGCLEPMESKTSEHANEDMLDGIDDFSEDEQLNAFNEVDFNVSTLISAFANHSIIQNLCWLLKFYKSNSLATNHYIISMLRRISEDLELHPMLYQLSLLMTFYDILAEQKSCPSKDYADIVDFLTSLVRKMLKKMKRQPLLFLEVLFWKSRRECHYINAEYLLGELGHLKKETRSWNSNQRDGEIGSSPVKAWTHRSIADALGDDEADVVITHDLGYQSNREKVDGVVDELTSTSGNKIDEDDNNGERLMEDESGTGIAPRRKKKLILDGESERQIKDLYEKFKDNPHCSRHIAEVLDPDGNISPAQISNKLKKLGLKVARRKNIGDSDEPLTTSPIQLEAQGFTNNDAVNLEGESLLVQHLQKRKRVCAFNEDQEALIRVLYEQFKDHKRCSYMIANAVDLDGKFTPAQVSRKLKQLGLSLPQKRNFGGKMHPKSEDLMAGSKDKMDKSDDETLISLIGREKVGNRKVVSNERLHEKTGEDKLSKDDSDDEMLSSVLKNKMKNRKVLSEQLHEHTSEDTLSRDDSGDEMLSSVLKKTRRSLLKPKNVELETIQIQEKILDNDSFNEGIQNVSGSSENGEGMKNEQVDDELMDSVEDEVSVSTFSNNKVTRRKLRMVIDPEDDDD